MRINLTKEEIVNSVYMQIGFSKKISLNLLEDIFESIVENLIKHKKIKISKFGTFIIKEKKSRIGINFQTRKPEVIKKRSVVLFKPSKEFKEFVNNTNE